MKFYKFLEENLTDAVTHIKDAKLPQDINSCQTDCFFKSHLNTHVLWLYLEQIHTTRMHMRFNPLGQISRYKSIEFSKRSDLDLQCSDLQKLQYESSPCASPPPNGVNTKTVRMYYVTALCAQKRHYQLQTEFRLNQLSSTDTMKCCKIAVRTHSLEKGKQMLHLSLDLVQANTSF